MGLDVLPEEVCILTTSLRGTPKAPNGKQALMSFLLVKGSLRMSWMPLMLSKFLSLKSSLKNGTFFALSKAPIILWFCSFSISLLSALSSCGWKHPLGCVNATPP
jgi:hypothetical protein